MSSCKLVRLPGVANTNNFSYGFYKTKQGIISSLSVLHGQILEGSKTARGKKAQPLSCNVVQTLNYRGDR